MSLGPLWTEQLGRGSPSSTEVGAGASPLSFQSRCGHSAEVLSPRQRTRDLLQASLGSRAPREMTQGSTPEQGPLWPSSRFTWLSYRGHRAPEAWRKSEAAMASRSHASESPPAVRCLSAPLPPCFIPLSIFDKHFLEVMSVPGLCSIKDLPWPGDAHCQVASSNISRWAEGRG